MATNQLFTGGASGSTSSSGTTNKQVQGFVGEDIAKKIGLTEADTQEYKDIGAYSSSAQAKIDTYKSNNRTPVQQFVGADIAKKIGLTEADAQEYNATGSYGIDAQTKIDAYKKQREIDSRTTKETAQDIVTGTQEAGVNLEKTTEQQKADIETNKSTDISTAEQQARETARLLKEQELINSKRDADARARLEEEKRTALDLLNKKQILAEEDARAEKEKLAREADYQRIQNQNAIIEANKNIEIQRQQSAWAYQKLGLGFSSGIINQSQQIATDGIAKIAEIKAKMNYQERLTGIEESKINTKLKEIDLQYTGLINETISSYSDKLDDLDSNAEKRIQELTKNLLLTNQQKDNKINEVLKSYRTEKTTLERQHIDDMFKIQDRGFQYQKEVEARVEKQKEVKLTNLSEELLNGTLAGMSAIEISKREDELGLPRGTINQKMDGLIRQGIRGMVDVTIGKDYIIGDIEYLKSQIVTQMKQGRTLGEAVDIIGGNYIKNNSEYKKIQANKYTKKTTSGGSSSSSTAIASTASTAGQLIANIYKEYGVKLDTTTANSLIKGGEGAVLNYVSGLENAKNTKLNKENTKTELEIEKDLSNFKNEYDNTELAESAYEKLIQSGRTKKEAFDILASQNSDLKVEQSGNGYKLIDTDYFGDDEVLNR